MCVSKWPVLAIVTKNESKVTALLSMVVFMLVKRKNKVLLVVG